MIRSRSRLVTPARYLTVSAGVMQVGRSLHIGDADINFGAIRGAAAKLDAAR